MSVWLAVVALVVIVAVYLERSQNSLWRRHVRRHVEGDALSTCYGRLRAAVQPTVSSWLDLQHDIDEVSDGLLLSGLPAAAHHGGLAKRNVTHVVTAIIGVPALFADKQYHLVPIRDHHDVDIAIRALQRALRRWV